MSDLIKATRKLSKFNFEKDGCAVALVGPHQGGPANSVTTLITKSTKGITTEMVTKASDVKVEMDMDDFLQKFFGLYYGEAGILAKLMGYGNDGDDDIDDLPDDKFQEFMNNYLGGTVTLMKSVHKGETKLSSLSGEKILSVLKAQQELEPILKLVQKAATKTQGGKTWSKEDYAYTPSDEPSSWKLVIGDKAHVAGAVAALGKGYRGNKVSIPEADLPGVKAKVRAAYKKFYPDNEVPDVIKKSVNTMVDTITKADHEVAVTKAVETALAPVQVELQKAQEKIAAYEAEKVAVKKAAREASLKPFVTKEELPNLMKAFETLGDEAWEGVLKSYATRADIEKASALFKEVGVSGESDQQEDKTAAILKARFAPKK